MDVYRAAWKDCLARVQSIIEELHSPRLQEITEQVHSAHLPSRTLSNLPHPEIPTFCVHGEHYLSKTMFIYQSPPPSGPLTYLDDVTTKVLEPPNVSGCHLYPSDCTNITAAMKSLVSTFTQRDVAEGVSRKWPSASLASYDIHTLVSWYEHLEEDECSQLIVIFHQFEQFESSVLEDFFYICSLVVSKLPFVFIFSMSSPPTPSYLHATYSRDALTLLRVKTMVAPQGWSLVKAVLEQTFFALDFEPDIMIGPPVLEYILDYFKRYNSSNDAILTILQLTFMKHFDEPLTILARDSFLSTESLAEADAKLSEPPSFPFLDSLLSRVALPPLSSGSLDVDVSDHESDWPDRSIATLLESVDAARARFRARSRGVKIGYRLLNLVKGVLAEMGYRVDGKKGKADAEGEDIEFMGRALRGRLARENKNAGAAVKELSWADAQRLLAAIHQFFQELPPHLRAAEAKARVKVVSWNSQLQRVEEELFPELTEAIGDWLTGFLDEKLKSLEECSLWDIWYTGSTPFPSELLNPSPRASIISALLHPHEYARFQADPESLELEIGETQDAPMLWELPDTSILFRRYLEGGKMLNVYDWYEAFALELETQRKEMRKRLAAEAGPSTPKKNKGKGKARELDEQMEMDGEDDDEEQWRMQIQARFIRALHELDYAGFIKHTGRKADHVLRTVFDVLD
ncbi:hypothetical protein GLOTRDRAFT_80817 [Gloeophyllum trabeum ATCC 11539]|uniref:Uncharacterized protein n=1 Tax=Gloeophyllum trabeum (strain ATCC 11539 / FP-39264 / Madison 617) TaxID=670483 RepID=S7PWP8_GLOTA|nr:uncharacterized protein GLOTRDRAFT_80817 [Gloeophyllum trabeum ATCC 11539]EPQ51812.1 hypothetical protein GLOTRDRAFT_80817 [Gloeophyllum trabeum ATCC 11539]